MISNIERTATRTPGACSWQAVEAGNSPFISDQQEAKMKTVGRLFAILLPAIGFLGAAAPAVAFRTDLTNYRCSGSLVFIGDSERRLADRCGDPDDSFVDNNSDVWVYNFGESRFVYYFTFTNGRLQRIQQVACDVDNPDCPYFR